MAGGRGFAVGLVQAAEGRGGKMSDRSRITHRCCAAFAHAWESGTDNEGYEPLCSIALGDDRAFVVVIGSGLPPINFCPWCGAAIGKKAEELK